MGNGHGRTRLHQPLQGVLHQSLALRIEGRGGLVKYQYGWILQNGTGYRDTLALSAGEPTATVADVRFELVLRLHDEVVGVGYPGRLGYLFVCGTVDAKGNVVAESVVEEDGLLVDVAYQLAQVEDAEFLHVDAVNEHLTLLHVVVAGNQVDKGRLARAGLSDDGNGLALGNDQVDVAQHPLVGILETDVAELYLMLEGGYVLRMFRLSDGVLGQQYLVHTLHRGQSLRYVIACLGEVLQGIDDGVEHHHIVDEYRTGQGLVVQHEHATKPEHDDDEDGAQKLAHGMGRRLADVDTHDVVAIGRIDLVEPAVHLLFGTEGLDDAQSAQRLLDLAHRVAPQGLGLDALRLQLATHIAHQPAHDGHDDEREERQLPGNEDEGRKIRDDEDRILEQHLERRHDGVLNLLHVATHTGNDVALALLREEAKWQCRNLLVELVADVTHHARADRNYRGSREEVGTRLEKSGESQEESY